MSVEGMWAFLSGSAGAPEDLRDGGIVVLETGRVFGGDSAMAYVGTYEVAGSRITARVRSWTWNKHYAESGMENVFGMTGSVDYHAVLEGERDGDDLVQGAIYPEGNPEFRLGAVLKKIADLP